MKRRDSFLPKYRFQEFSSGWEKIELGSISNKVTTKNRDESIKETLTNSAEFGIVSQRDFFDKDISNTANIGGYYIVEENDFVYNPRISNYAPFGPINRNNLGRKGIMSPLYHVFKTKGVNHDFLSSYFETTRWHKFMHIAGDKGARADRFAIGYKEFEKMPIYMPDLKEQTQIGNFFQQLDKLIELQTRAVESAETYKKAMLQKMFPQKGEKVPRVRFAGFSGDWEEKKLGDLADLYQPKTITQNDLCDEGYPVFGANGFIGFYKEANHFTDQVLISARGENTGSPNYVRAPIWITGNSMVVNIDGKSEIISKSYLFNYFLANSLKSYVTGGAQPQLTKEVLNTVVITYPNPEEQTQIGNFFEILDQQIEQQAQKLATYQQLKKAMLQRMFV